MRSQISLAPFILSVGLGFLVGIFGHIIKSPSVVLLGIFIVGIGSAASVLVPLILYGNPY